LGCGRVDPIAKQRVGILPIRLARSQSGATGELQWKLVKQAPFSQTGVK